MTRSSRRVRTDALNELGPWRPCTNGPRR
jgi:hypothetical protein